jgi:CyaY protein
MNESEFNQLADSVLLQIEQAIEAGGEDLDFETVGGILEIECGNGSKVIINRQTPNRELWVAAKSGGFHFRLHQQRWIDTRDGRELGNALSEIIFSQCAEKIAIKIIV